MKKLTIIDTTSLYYSASQSAQKHNLSLEETTQILVDRFNSILIETRADYYLSFTDKGHSFRRELLPQFKNDRVKPEIPFPYLYELKQYSIDNLSTINHDKLESDDLVILHYLHLKSEYDITIAAIDSDLRQVAGTFFNYGYRRNNSFPFITITEEQADLNLWISVLAGSHNGLKGLNKVGIKKAISLLEGKSNKRELVLNAYINGIPSKSKNKKAKGIDGLGEIGGFTEFDKNFISSYLLRSKQDCEYYGIEFEYSCVQEVKRDTINYSLNLTF